MSGARKFLISVGLIALFLVAGYAAAKVLQHTAPEVVKTEKAIPPPVGRDDQVGSSGSD